MRKRRHLPDRQFADYAEQIVASLNVFLRTYSIAAASTFCAGADEAADALDSPCWTSHISAAMALGELRSLSCPIE